VRLALRIGVLACCGLASGLGASAVAAPLTTPCSTKEVSLSLQAHPSKDGLLIEAGFSHFKGSACRLTLGYTLTIQTGNSPSTRVRAINGNPATIERPLTLAPKQRVTYSVLWSNWCGQHHTYLINGLDSARGGLIIKTPPPACTAHGQSSTVRTLT